MATAHLASVFWRYKRLSNKNDTLYASVHLLLRSPAFLFHFEVGGSQEESTRVKLTDYEVANRISYGLVGGPPDNELFAAAEAGQLKTLAQVQSHA